MIRFASLGLLSAFLCTPAFAIVNIEDIRIAPAVEGFSGKLSLGLSGKRGNSDTDDIELGSRLQWQQAHSRQFIVLSYDYSQAQEQRSTNKSFFHARHVQQFHPQRAWEAFVQVESNEFARLSFRGLIGGGMRWTLNPSNEQYSLHLGTGAFVVRETFEDDANYTDLKDDDFSRANIYIAYKHKINQQLSLVSTGYYQPRLDDSQDYRALEQTSLHVKMSDQLSLSVSLDLSHDNRPPDGVEKTDISYKTALNYRF